MFPFRPQWVSPTSCSTPPTARSSAGRAPAAPRARVAFSADVAFTRPAFTPKRRAFPAAGPQPVRGLMHPAISPDGAHGRVYRARRSVARLDACRRRGARAADQRRVRRDQSGLVARRRAAGVLLRSRRRDEPLGARHEERRRPAARHRRHARRVVARRRADRVSRSAIAAAGRGGGVARGAAGARPPLRARPSQLVARRPRGGDVGAAALLVALPRGHQPGAVGGRAPDTSLDGAALRPDRWIDPMPHKSVGMREDFGPVWSPDGREMAAIVDGYLTTYPVAADGTPPVRPRRVSPELASSPSWTADSRRLLYQTVDRLPAGRSSPTAASATSCRSWSWTRARPTDVDDRARRAAVRRPHGAAARERGHRHRRQPHHAASTPHRDDLHRRHGRRCVEPARCCPA